MPLATSFPVFNILGCSEEMVSITPEVEFHIRQNFPWTKLPSSVKAVGSPSPPVVW